MLEYLRLTVLADFKKFYITRTYGDYLLNNNKKYLLTTAKIRILSARLESKSYIYAHHFDVPSFVPCPVFHK